MPLYDFRCRQCEAELTLLLKVGEPGHCPKCGDTDLEKQLTPFAIGGKGGPAPATPRPGATAAATPAGHRCHGGCSHGAPKTDAKEGCATATYADSLVKKYLG